MSELYGMAQRTLQDRHDTRRLADRLEELSRVEFDAEDRGFIGSAAFFFLSTVDGRGRPTVSYKGGQPGFVQVDGPGTLVFPSYDGNGMFLSLGNILAMSQVGLLFIDFEKPRRLRVQGVAQVVPNEGPDSRPGAQYLVRVAAEQIFVNCGRYIHHFSFQQLSPHVPDEQGRQPVAAWKRIDVIEETLPEADRRTVAAAGGPIAIDAYRGEEAPPQPP